ncbi:hypothetical protein ABEW34_03205 [Paenibacillus algorifonticola]|uniref:Uncharacterized protein n=1 Tax=Paenibacillus sp. BIHB 4019 TaxID=1870819 RepID=A0A1B2DBS4_9BACL|nr:MULTISPECIES: hypothetical protein [unclassified Paenibacillus]ANY65161.1 hypothetical protein BBD42_00700 [Paenibacillus sp. BIHB 4019]KQO01173.1 hypothetical protein ASF12_15120 [Paenibacillus sp. Leaf72]
MTDPITFTNYSASEHRRAAEVLPFIDAYIGKKEQEIIEIEQMVERYEKRRLKEERAYQSMSAFRRMLSGKKPDHHLAVEHIHFVRKPMEKVRALKLEIENVRKIQNSSAPTDMVTVPFELANDLL